MVRLDIDKRTLVELLVITVFLAITIYMTERYGKWGDVDHYWVNINDIVVEHKMPYSQSKFEYPSLTILVFLIPRLFSWDLNSFHFAFGIFAAVAFLLGVIFSYKIADRFGVSHTGVFIISLATVIFMNIFIVARYDVFPAVLIVLAILLYVYGKHDWAFVVIAIATMVKLYPGLVALCFFLPYVARRDWKAIARGLGICTAIAILSELPFIIDNISTAFAYLSYHSDRGIQVESVVGSFIEIYNYFVPGSCYVVFNYGSDNLAGPVPDMIAPFMNIVMAGSMLLFLLLALHIAVRMPPEDEEGMNRFVIMFATIFVLVFIVFNKVYSAQYGIWILAMIPLCLVSFYGGKVLSPIFVTTIVLAVLSFVAAAVYMRTAPFDLGTILPLLEFLKNMVTVAALVILLGSVAVDRGVLGRPEVS